LTHGLYSYTRSRHHLLARPAALLVEPKDDTTEREHNSQSLVPGLILRVTVDADNINRRRQYQKKPGFQH
jgi:hypothetical protein